MYEDLIKQNKSITDAYLKMQEAQRQQQEQLSESDDSGGDMSSYNKYLLAKTGDLPRTKAGYMNAVNEESDDEIQGRYDKWMSDVKETHPGKPLKFKSRFEKGDHTTSAEVSGEDRSYGMWDHNKNEGHVFED